MRPSPMIPSVLPASWRAHELFAVPALLDQALVGGGDVARQPQHQGQGVFGRGDGIAARGVHHNDALAGGGLGVDVVHADAGPGNRPQALVAGQGFGGDFHAAAADGPVGLEQGLAQFFAFEPGANDHFDVSGRLQQVEPVLGQVVQYDDSRHGFFERVGGSGSGAADVLLRGCGVKTDRLYKLYKSCAAAGGSQAAISPVSTRWSS